MNRVNPNWLADPWDANREVWKYGRILSNTKGATYGMPRGRTTTSRWSVVGVSLGQPPRPRPRPRGIEMACARRFQIKVVVLVVKHFLMLSNTIIYYRVNPPSGAIGVGAVLVLSAQPLWCEVYVWRIHTKTKKIHRHRRGGGREEGRKILHTCWAHFSWRLRHTLVAGRKGSSWRCAMCEVQRMQEACAGVPNNLLF